MCPAQPGVNIREELGVCSTEPITFLTTWSEWEGTLEKAFLRALFRTGPARLHSYEVDKSLILQRHSLGVAISERCLPFS